MSSQVNNNETTPSASATRQNSRRWVGRASIRLAKDAQQGGARSGRRRRRHTGRFRKDAGPL